MGLNSSLDWVAVVAISGKGIYCTVFATEESALAAMARVAADHKVNGIESVRMLFAREVNTATERIVVH